MFKKALILLYHEFFRSKSCRQQGQRDSMRALVQLFNLVDTALCCYVALVLQAAGAAFHIVDTVFHESVISSGRIGFCEYGAGVRHRRLRA